MSNFIQFRDSVSKSFDQIAVNGPIYQAAIAKDDLWDLYLASFPEGTNNLYRERTEHDCQCCKSFIRNIGRVLGLDTEGNMVSIWDNLDLPEGSEYKVVAEALSKACKDSGISGIYLNDESVVGRKESYETLENGEVRTWNHFFQVLPKQAYSTKKCSIGTVKGRLQTNAKVLKRSIVEIEESAVQNVLDLIEENNLHRGSEFAPIVKGLAKLQEEFKKATDKSLFIWNKTVEMHADLHDCNIRGTAIGTLLVDLSSGTDLEDAVRSYEKKVAGDSYKRPKAIITEKMRDACKARVKELGIESSFPRRFATREDISVNDVIFADSSIQQFMEDSIFDIVPVAKKPITTSDDIEEITLEQFIQDVVPLADSLEVLLENKHESNLMSVIAPIFPESPCIMKWGNNFSWSFNGEFAETVLSTAVRQAGGRIDGALGFSFSWNHTGQNQSLMDLHVFLPTHMYSPSAKTYIEKTCEGKEKHDHYGTTDRVGWNHREHSETQGSQDVDNVNPPGKRIPVENITFPEMGLLPEGTYVFKVHNWKLRTPNSTGFKAELRVNGETFSYDYPQPVDNKEWITVAKATLKNGVFEVEHFIAHEDVMKEVWGLQTKRFHKVNMMMRSPNMWENSSKTGNDLVFFILDGCLNPDDARGFYNEFLVQNLDQDRKVFEVLGSALKAKHSENQLSGLGFSSTLRNDVTVRVTGTGRRLYKIKF